MTAHNTTMDPPDLGGGQDVRASELPPHQEIGVLTIAEKKFLLAVERGDVANTRR